MKIVLNLLSLFVVPAVAALLASASSHIIVWAAGVPDQSVAEAVGVVAVMAFVANTVRVIAATFNQFLGD